MLTLRCGSDVAPGAGILEHQFIYLYIYSKQITIHFPMSEMSFLLVESGVYVFFLIDKRAL